MERRIPAVPGKGQKIPIIIDTDAACEIDDLYAVALAVKATDRFDIKGFNATHFAGSGGEGTTRQSYDVLKELLSVAGVEFPGQYGGTSHAVRR